MVFQKRKLKEQVVDAKSKKYKEFKFWELRSKIHIFICLRDESHVDGFSEIPEWPPQILVKFLDSNLHSVC